MSREVRRVPLDFRHPTEHNPNWERQSRPFMGRPHVPSRLHGPTERFIGLMDDYPGSLAEWEQEAVDIAARTGHHWEFDVEYHLTGFQGQADDAPVAHPFYVSDDMSVTVRDEDHLHELVTAQIASERPEPADYMPMFDVPESDLGWCLYETVSEGCPVTPVFATAAELIDHLATVGQDWDRVPLRREAAERIVDDGGTFGSMAVVGGVLYRATEDADRLAEALGKGGPR